MAFVSPLSSDDGDHKDQKTSSEFLNHPTKITNKIAKGRTAAVKKQSINRSGSRTSGGRGLAQAINSASKNRVITHQGSQVIVNKNVMKEVVNSNSASDKKNQS